LKLIYHWIQIWIRIKKFRKSREVWGTNQRVAALAND